MRSTPAFADLHLHSNCSDGSDLPTRVVMRAKACGVGAMALTDHDTVAGVAEARAAAREADIDFLAGTEISAGLDGLEVHIVGLGIDVENDKLLNTLATLAESRRNRASEILEKLAGEGIALILPDDVPQDSIGRMHIARALFDAGHTRSTQEGFDRFLNPGRPAWVHKATVEIDTAIDAIHAAGGLAFLAHPGLNKNLRRQFDILLEYPFDGIEAYHVSHSQPRTSEYERIAQTRGLLVSGGSDCHGMIKGKPEMGNIRMPMKYHAAIIELLG